VGSRSAHQLRRTIETEPLDNVLVEHQSKPVSDGDFLRRPLILKIGEMIANSLSY
jgi:hypothetical protein